MDLTQTSSMNGPTFLRGSAMLVIWGGLDQGKTSEEEEELNDWWSNEHLPERLAIDGFLRTRRFHALREGISQYLVWYEVANLEVLTSPDYMTALNNPTPGTKKFMPILASMNRSACRVLYSVSRPQFSKCKEGPLGGTIAHTILERPQCSETRQQVLHWFQQHGWQDSVRHPGTLALHLIEHDDAASSSGSTTKSYDDVRFQDQPEDSSGRWILLVEYAEPITAPFAKHRAVSEAMRREIRGCGVVSGDTQYYSLICAAAK